MEKLKIEVPKTTTIEEILSSAKCVMDLGAINRVVEEQIDESVFCTLDIDGLCDYFNLGNYEKVNVFWFLILHELREKIEGDKAKT